MTSSIQIRVDSEFLKELDKVKGKTMARTTAEASRVVAELLRHNNVTQIRSLRLSKKKERNEYELSPTRL